MNHRHGSAALSMDVEIGSSLSEIDFTACDRDLYIWGDLTAVPKLTFSSAQDHGVEVLNTATLGIAPQRRGNQMREYGDHSNAFEPVSRVPPLMSVDLPFALDAGERRIVAIKMPPLLTGEFKLLAYLGGCPGTWHSSYKLAVGVYQRDDAAGRQLVWKYASTLRKKLATSLPELIQLCRRRGYSCRAPVKVVGDG